MPKTQKKFPPKWEVEHDDKYIIPPDIYLGLKWKGDNGEDYTSVISDYDYINGKRKAEFRCTNYLGSIGAMHYYGRIEVRSPSGQVTGEEGSHGGYMGKNAPDLERIVLQVQRRLTKVEKDMSGDIIGKRGDMTYRWNTEEEILPAAIALFKRKFAPGWVLIDIYEFDNDGNPKILCET